MSKSTKPMCGKRRPGVLQWTRKEWKKEASGSLAAARLSLVWRRDGEPAQGVGGCPTDDKQGPRVQD